MQSSAPRFPIGKVRISAVTMVEALRLVDELVHAGRSGYLCVANVKTVSLAQKDKEFCRISNESLLTIPDGMPLVWFARLAGVRGVERVTGPDLMMKVLEASVKKGYSHYFYGDTEETLSRVARVIHERYPGTAIVGMCSPPFRQLTDDEHDSAVREINTMKPTFVWVGLGAPKQEFWMARAATATDEAIYVGVGAAFRFLIGEYRHPPAAMQKCGLEGLYWRLLKDPLGQTLWFCRHVPAFGLLLLRMVVRVRLLGKGLAL